MEQVIDVEYKEITKIEDKTNEELCKEVNLYWNQMEALGRLGIEFAFRAGKRLNVIKNRLAHGEWEDWCEKNLDFSARKANRMMKLATKMKNEDSIFFKSDNLSDIGISKVYELLAAPEEVAEEVLQNSNIQDMTVRELKEEISKLKEQNEQLAQSAEDNHNADDEETERLREQIAALEAQIKDQPPDQTEEITEKEKEILNLKEKLEKEKEKAKKAKEDIDRQKNDAAEAARKQAEEEAQKKFDEETKLLQDSNRIAAEEIDRLQRQLQNNQNTDLVEFKLKSQQLQTDFNACLQSILNVEQEDPQQAGKMRAALRMVMGKLQEEING